MLITLDYDARKLRAWINELPNALYPVADITEYSQSAVPSTLSGPRHAGVEYYRYTEHILTGLLGATFIPQASDRIIVEIVSSSGAGQTISWSINPFYRADVGLWSPLAVEFVTKGILESPMLNKLGAGILRFESAAEGPPIIMRWLADAVVALLVISDTNLTQEGLQAVMEQVGPPYLWPAHRHRNVGQ